MRRAKVPSHTTTTSRPGYLLCPVCGSGELLPLVGGFGLLAAGCDSCGCAFASAIVGTLKQIAVLPDALGKHACEECGHPEMRCLPDGTYHCPACGSEVLPIDASSTPAKLGEYSVAYWMGWVDGRFGERGNFVDNPSLARWEDPSDRLDYYRGHGAGSDTRRASNSQNPDAREKHFG